jgi:hypothetical protein
MLLAFIIFFLVSKQYTLEINPFSFIVPFLFLPTPGINFELGLKRNFSLNFEVNNKLLIEPLEGEVGIREYLEEDKALEGFYLYQGLAWGWLNIWGPDKKYREVAKYIPCLILTLGYKSISKRGFVVDPFLGLRLMYGGESFGIKPIGFLPALGLYLGYAFLESK